MAVARPPVLDEPLVPRLPLHPPEAVQVVALLELQDSVAALPDSTLDGVADRLTVGRPGAGITVTAAVWLPVPPGPIQVRV